VSGTQRHDVPSYQDLLERADAPPGSSWGIFGAGDQLGTANFLTPERLVSAAQLVRRGRVFNLDYAINAFDPYPTGTRPPAEHHIFANNPNHRDDYLDSFFLQSTSQIDALRHIRHPLHGWYGGVADEDVNTGAPALGIQLHAERGLCGRGVLLDVERYLASAGDPIDQSTNRMITVADLEATAAQQKVDLEFGDIILLRTGWAGHFLAADAQGRNEMNQAWACPGLQQSHQILEWLWDRQISMIAADNQGVEAVPPDSNSPFMDAPGVPASVRGKGHSGLMHRPLIALLGMPLGELWSLDELARDCAEDGVYEFLVCAKPLYLVGGCGSPANALAIK
jgi:kynurenine formamidase